MHLTHPDRTVASELAGIRVRPDWALRSIEKIASTVRATRALSDADAAKSYPAFAFGPAAVLFSQYGTSTEAPAGASAILFDAAVNRKVDGAFTDMTH